MFGRVSGGGVEELQELCLAGSLAAKSFLWSVTDSIVYDVESQRHLPISKI